MSDLMRLIKSFRELEEEIALLLSERNAAVRDLKAAILQRDEARKEVCTMRSWNFDKKTTPQRYAELRKWDCFKENTDG